MQPEVIVALIVWVLSLAGMLWMLWKKFPLLAELRTVHRGKGKELGEGSRGRRMIDALSIFLLPMKNVSLRTFTEKSLAKFHIRILKIENSIRGLREQLRRRGPQQGEQKEQEKREQKNFSYWEILKKK